MANAPIAVTPEFNDPSYFERTKNSKGKGAWKCTLCKALRGMTAAAALRHEASEDHQRRLQEARAWDWNDNGAEPDWGAPIGPEADQSAWEYHTHGERITEFIAFWLDGILAEERGERGETMEEFMARYDETFRTDDWGGWGEQAGDGWDAPRDAWAEVDDGGAAAAAAWGGTPHDALDDWGPPQPEWPTAQWNADAGWGCAAEEATPWDGALADHRAPALPIVQKPSNSDRTSPGRSAGRRKNRGRAKAAAAVDRPLPAATQWKGGYSQRRRGKADEFLEMPTEGKVKHIEEMIHNLRGHARRRP